MRDVTPAIVAIVGALLGAVAGVSIGISRTRATPESALPGNLALLGLALGGSLGYVVGRRWLASWRAAEAARTAAGDPPEENVTLFSESVRLLRERATAGGWKPAALVVALVALTCWFVRATPFVMAVALASILAEDVLRFLAMRMVGHDDRRRLLLPKLRAWLPRSTSPNAAWKTVLVILVPIVPVVGATFWLSASTVVFGSAAPVQIALVVAWIVAFDLLPFMPLAGGQVLKVIVFRRAAQLEAPFQALTGVAMLWIGWQYKWTFLMVLGGAGALLSPPVHRLAMAARSLDASALPRDLGKLGEESARVLFEAADSLMSAQIRSQHSPKHAALYAAVMEDLHGRVTIAPPSLAVSALLLLAYVGCALAAALSFVGAATVNHFVIGR